MATTVVAGRISDRSGRRKSFVIVVRLRDGAGGGHAGRLADLARRHGRGGACSAAATASTSRSTRRSSRRCCRRRPGRAKDLGIINIANSAPQVLAPALAAPIVAGLGGYPVLYGLTAVVTVLGGVFVYKIRSVA